MLRWQGNTSCVDSHQLSSTVLRLGHVFYRVIMLTSHGKGARSKRAKNRTKNERKKEWIRSKTKCIPLPMRIRNNSERLIIGLKNSVDDSWWESTHDHEWPFHSTSNAPVMGSNIAKTLSKPLSSNFPSRPSSELHFGHFWLVVHHSSRQPLQPISELQQDETTGFCTAPMYKKCRN